MNDGKLETDISRMGEYRQLQISGSDWSYGSQWGDQMERAVCDIFKNIDPSNTSGIIDIGCGEGRGLQKLSDMGFKNLCGVDISQEKINHAKNNRNKKIRFHEQDFHEDMSNLGVFDIGFSSHTLEHCYDFNRAINSILSIIVKKLYFIVPIGETEEEVKKFNPSHTNPFKDLDHVHASLMSIGIRNFSLQQKGPQDRRMCDEVWGCIYK